MSTFNKIYKKVANNGNSNDYQVVGQVGVNGVNLDIMRGANSSSAGEIGLVPKPSAGANNRYLRSDGTWSVPPVYSHPTYNSHSSGLYKISTNNLGHVTGASAVTKSDITALGIPGQDTTYGLATSSSDGLMSDVDKSKLDKLNNNIFIKFAGSFEANGNKHWTSFNPGEYTTLDLTSAKTYEYQSDFVSYNSNTITIRKKGLYLFHFYFGYNTYSGRIGLNFFKNGEQLAQTTIRLCTFGDRELYDNRLTALYLLSGDTIQLKITTSDKNVSNYVIPHYFGMYCLDYENKY